MYIHRVAIDANQANARGGLAVMTELERLHDACLIENLRSALDDYKDMIYAGTNQEIENLRLQGA